MHDAIQLSTHVDDLGHIVPDESEFFIIDKVGQVFPAASHEVIHPNDFVPFFQQTITKMGTEEAGGSGEKNAHEFDLQVL